MLLAGDSEDSAEVEKLQQSVHMSSACDSKFATKILVRESVSNLKQQLFLAIERAISAIKAFNLEASMRGKRAWALI